MGQNQWVTAAATAAAATLGAAPTAAASGASALAVVTTHCSGATAVPDWDTVPSLGWPHSTQFNSTISRISKLMCASKLV